MNKISRKEIKEIRGYGEVKGFRNEVDGEGSEGKERNSIREVS